MADQENIFPIFEQVLQRGEKEALLKQRSCAIWMTGLSGSGKSTIAVGLERKLHQEGFLTETLDGDNIRTGINNNLDFSETGRKENIRRIAEVTKLFVNCGVITIDCFVSPMKSMRASAKDIIGKEDFIEVFVNTPLEVCEKRDTKGLYAKARKGEIKDFTGVNAPFEAPSDPDIELLTEGKSVEQSVEELFEKILPKLQYKEG